MLLTGAGHSSPEPISLWTEERRPRIFTDRLIIGNNSSAQPFQVSAWGFATCAQSTAAIRMMESGIRMIYKIASARTLQGRF